MIDFLKSNVERTLDRLGITVRDDNNEPRSADELTRDVMAFLDKCTPEYANEILFEINLAAAIDRAAEKIEQERERKKIPVKSYTLGEMQFFKAGTLVYVLTTRGTHGWATVDYKGGYFIVIPRFTEDPPRPYLHEDDYELTWKAYKEDISQWIRD